MIVLVLSLIALCGLLMIQLIIAQRHFAEAMKLIQGYKELVKDGHELCRDIQANHREFRNKALSVYQRLSDTSRN